MRSFIFGLLAGLALASGGAAQDLPPTREALNFKAPEGFTPFSAAGDDAYYTAEYRLATEARGAPSRTLAFQAFRDRTVREPAAFNAKLLAERVQYCPEATSESLPAVSEQGFETVVTSIACPNAPGGRGARTEFIKSVKGDTIFLVVDYTLYGALDAAQKQDVLAYLNGVGLCRRNGGC